MDTLNVVSCYAPTRAAHREEKDKFFNDLQQAVSAIPSDQPYDILPDFNVQVGSRETVGDPWRWSRVLQGGILGHLTGPSAYRMGGTRSAKGLVRCNFHPIPKRENLSSCDNWRGISLLDVVGKVMARLLQERLQLVAEIELPESQCGFRKGRGCSDMTFTLRQLVEKSIEHQSKQSITFVDLRKAYDSIPCTALWRILEKLGVPKIVVNLVKSFHNGMKAQLSINGELLEEKIDVNNGLRQGCTMAPTLFNLYACLVMVRWTAWMEDVEGAGTCLLYKFARKLFRRSTREANQTQMRDCQFADMQ